MGLFDENTVKTLNRSEFLALFADGDMNRDRAAQAYELAQSIDEIVSAQRLVSLLSTTDSTEAIVKAARLRLQGTDGLRGVMSPREVDYREGLSAFLRSKELTPALLQLLVKSFLLENGGQKVYLGEDGRDDEEKAFVTACYSALEEETRASLFLGTVPSAVVAYASLEGAGVMVTASHNPATDNGIKFFVGGRKLTKTEEYALTARAFELAQREEVSPKAPLPSPNQAMLIRYSTILTNEVSLNELKSRSLIIDCANGAGKELLDHISVHAEVICTEGVINDRCGAALYDSAREIPRSGPYPSALAQMLALRVDEFGGTHFGIALDGDADRAIVLVAEEDSSSIRILGGDEIAALLLPHLAKRFASRKMVTYTIESNPRVIQGIEAAHPHVTFLERSVGDRNLAFGVEDELILGFEESGHVLWPVDTDLGVLFSGSGLATGLLAVANYQKELIRTLVDSERVVVTVFTEASKRWYHNSSLFEETRTLIEAAVNTKREIFAEDEDLLLYRLGDGEVVYARASGTEPKLQIVFPAKESLRLERVVQYIGLLSDSFLS